MTWIVGGGQQLELEARGRAGARVRAARRAARARGAARRAARQSRSHRARRRRASASGGAHACRVLCRRPGAARLAPRARRRPPPAPALHLRF